MSTFSIFMVLIVIVALLLVLVIMVQNPKGGGLSSSFGGGGGQIVGGVKKTGDFLDKSTWTLATILIALILLSNLSLRNSSASQESKLLDSRPERQETTVPQQNNAIPPAATDADSSGTTE
ncbi:preprotein translocase subunit SecG [Sinomicrobium sp.]